MTITPQTTVAEIATAVPSSVRVFQKFGIDFCCGGKTPIGTACAQHGLSFSEVATAVDAATLRPIVDVDWAKEPLTAVIDHIIATYHEPLRDELPRLQALATKVAAVHESKAAFLERVAELVSELSADLTDHMRKEELILFPAIKRLETGHVRHVDRIAAPIVVLEQEHDHAGAILAELRALTSNYATPAWACTTFRALYDGLAELEATMHVHVHLENNVLFPRARQRAEAVGLLQS